MEVFGDMLYRLPTSDDDEPVLEQELPSPAALQGKVRAHVPLY